MVDSFGTNVILVEFQIEWVANTDVLSENRRSNEGKYADGNHRISSWPPNMSAIASKHNQADSTQIPRSNNKLV